MTKKIEPDTGDSATSERRPTWIYVLIAVLYTASIVLSALVTSPSDSSDSLKERVAALELLTQKLSAEVVANAAFASNQTSANRVTIEDNVGLIGNNSKVGVSNANKGAANAAMIQRNAGAIADNQKGIANQSVALANVTASILNIIGSDVDAAVALEVPIVVARSLGNMTSALQALQTLVKTKLSSAELMFEQVGFAFPASAKPLPNGCTPLQQCAGDSSGCPNNGECCLVGGPLTGDATGDNLVPCGSVDALLEPCPLFCNASITCPQGSAPVSTECLGGKSYDGPYGHVFIPNVTASANGFHKVTCLDPQSWQTLRILQQATKILTRPGIV